MTKNQYPLVSVIIPVYKTEKYLRRCLESVLNQSYRNIEVVCVDDASPDDSIEILNNYKNDINFFVLRHDENKGLFNARVTGAKFAHGDYFMFIDSDDYISLDWVRLLVQRATEDGSDIAIGQFLYEEEDGTRKYINMDVLRAPLCLEKEEVFSKFVKQHGTCFSWHVIWNKLYSRTLWDDALPQLEEFANAHKGFTMCEDLAFSAALWTRAQKVTNFTDGAMYYYCLRDSQETNAQNANKALVEKRLNDIVAAFGFFEQQVKQNATAQKHLDQIYFWKLYLARIWFKNLGQKNSDEALVRKKFGILDKDSLCFGEHPDQFYFNVISELDNRVYEWGEDIKRAICSAETRVVSFDVFDTLIFRPFYYPADAFALLNLEFNRKLGVKSFVDFTKFRFDGEWLCREARRQTHRQHDDLNLDEIYAHIEKTYGFPHDVLEYIKQLEIQNEIELCYPRQTGKQLYELAVQQGKKVIFTTDMYLPREVIQQILEKNGYKCDTLYLSSETRMTKATGRIYYHILKTEKIRGSQMVHIGDNWYSDMESAKRNDVRCFYLENPITLMECNNPSIYTGEAFENARHNHGTTQDVGVALFGFVGMRSAFALIAHKMYDNPYRPFARGSDFDCNGYFVGYAALGGYLLAVTNWIAQTAKENNHDRVNFVARDGYLPMLAYELARKYDSSLPPSGYLYISRKALAMVDVTSPKDLFAINNKVNMQNYPPLKLFKMMEPFMTASKEEIIKELGYTDELFSNRVVDRCECERILSVFGKHLSQEKLSENRRLLKKYFSAQVTPDSMLFDIGYSGRAESALAELLGYNIHSLYVHSNLQILHDRKTLSNFRNETFYDYAPKITGVLREHMFMKLAPSTVGYREENGEVLPLFEKYKGNSTVDNITTVIQQGALDFVEDFYHFFGHRLEQVPYRKTDMAVLFENFLHFSKEIDRKLFGCVEFEDDFGMGKKINVCDFWAQQMVWAETQPFPPLPKQVHHLDELRRHEEAKRREKENVNRNLAEMSRLKRAFYFLLFEPKTFWRKLFKKDKK